MDDGLSMPTRGVTAMRDDEFAAMRDFLWSRLDEDEAAARALKPGKNQGVAELQARVLADVEAKRRLLNWVEEWPQRLKENDEGTFLWKGAARKLVAGLSRDFRSPVILALVAAYDGHRDFYPSWRLVEVEDECESREGTPGAQPV
ncbi:DUF6221 family protein [Streptomyces griseofuscus]|uniref:DUF6221 family protein n=1 Tax=Streptomyces griseofuscus TaxID=146922 RepID=UPI003452146B